MFEKRKLTGLAERVLSVFPKTGICFNMQQFPGISDDEIEDCANIFVMAEHLSSAICAAYYSYVVSRKFGHTPNILLVGKSHQTGMDILRYLGIRDETIFVASDISEAYKCENLGKRLVVLLPLHASLKIKEEALRWNTFLIGERYFINVEEDFTEISKTENFFTDLYQSVKVLERNLGKRCFLFKDPENEAFRNSYYGQNFLHKGNLLLLMDQYVSKYEWQKKSLVSSGKKIAKQKERLIKKYAPLFCREKL